MFIGHYAVGFAAKRARPEISLGALFLAAQWADLVWPVLVLAGVERVEIRPGATAVNHFVFVHYPYSHSLAALAAWGVLFALAHRVARKTSLAASILLAAVVVSHWVLDFATHVPDMPLGLSGPFVGLGLWRSLPATIAVEGTLFAAGLALYVRATAARDRIGSAGLAALAVFLVVMYFASLAAPPPPNVRAVAWGTLATVFFPVWGYWVDRHRETRMPRTD
jgi:hypothetical protein